MDNPGTGIIAAAADAVATIHVRPFRMSTFCFTIFVDKPFMVKVRLSLWYLGNASRMAGVSRFSKSHFLGKWLLIRNISCWSLSRSPRLFEQLARSFEARLLHQMTAFVAQSLHPRRFLCERRRSSYQSIEIDFIFLANFKSLKVNRVAVKIRNKW